MPFCQALAPAVVAALAWEILRFTIAVGGSCCARIHRLTAFTIAVVLIPAPAMAITPPAATSANPATMALELAELICMLVLVIFSPDVDPGQSASVPA